MKVIVLLILFCLPIASEVEIRRNILWNDLIMSIRRQNEEFKYIQDYLKKNELIIVPGTIDVEVLKKIDGARDECKIQEKKLKGIKEEIIK